MFELRCSKFEVFCSGSRPPTGPGRQTFQVRYDSLSCRGDLNHRPLGYEPKFLTKFGDVPRPRMTRVCATKTIIINYLLHFTGAC
jgi:hypothetical protein